MKVELYPEFLSVIMLQQTNYETLRSWYLAKLRKSAIEAQVSGQLTPSALIAADREVIEKLIAERSEADDNKEVIKVKNTGGVKFALCLWLYLIVGIMFSLFLFCLADASILPDVFTVCLNPANIAQTSTSTPNPLVLIIVQLVLYVYPITVIPYVMFVKKND